MATLPTQPRRLHYCDHRRYQPALECATGPLHWRMEERLGSPLWHANRRHGQPSTVIAATAAAAKHSAPEKAPCSVAPADNRQYIIVSPLLSRLTTDRGTRQCMTPAMKAYQTLVLQKRL